MRNRLLGLYKAYLRWVLVRCGDFTPAEAEELVDLAYEARRRGFHIVR